MPQVSVVIPAYNAEGTIAETLDSILAQSFSDFEAIVVSDGSTDRTASFVRDYAARDARIRLVEQANAGVAAARNRGIEESDSRYIAPVDADDLWHPQKLAFQVRRFEDASAETGLVYCWYHPIDEGSRIIEPVRTPIIEGFVLHRHLVWNFVGNGSAPLIARHALGNVRYESELAARGAGGCEDYLLQLQLSREWDFACVPAHLVGYRQGAGRMSGNRLAMLRSHLETYNRMRRLVDEPAASLCDRGWARTKVFEASLYGGRRHWGKAAMAGTAAMFNSPAATLATFREQARILSKVHGRSGRIGKGSDRPSFYETDPFARALPWVPSAEIVRAEAFDHNYSR